MLRSIAGMGRIFAAAWPALLAWYLAGSVVRASIIAIAAPIGPDNPLGALLLVPVAVLARLVSYIGMFLVLRRTLAGYRSLAGADIEFTSFRDGVGELLRVLLASIGPFFALYAIIGLLAEDLSEYARAAYRYSLGAETRGFEVGASPLAFVVLALSFGLRFALKAFAQRLPGWLEIAQVYLEATWVFVALTAINSLFGPVTRWIADREVVHWVQDSREFLTGLWRPIRIAFEGVDWATPVALQLVLLPLAWLLVACIIYLRALGNVVEDAKRLPSRLGARIATSAERLPPLLRRYEHLFTESWDEIGQPIAFATRVLRRTGLVNIMVFLAAYGILFALGQWASRLIYTLIGPHDSSFWWIADAGVSAGLAAIVEPVRIILLAAAFDFCSRRWSAWRLSAPVASASAAIAPAVSAPART